MIQSKRRRRRRSRKEEKEVEERATRLLNTSAKLGSRRRENTCVQLLYRLKWKSKEII